MNFRRSVLTIVGLVVLFGLLTFAAGFNFTPSDVPDNFDCVAK